MGIGACGQRGADVASGRGSIRGPSGSVRPQPPRPSLKDIQRALARKARDTLAPRPPTRPGISKEQLNKIRDGLEKGVDVANSINNVDDFIDDVLSRLPNDSARPETNPRGSSRPDHTGDQDEEKDCINRRSEDPGYIDYDDLDFGISDPRGRAQGVTACLTEPRLGTGSRATYDPPGLDTSKGMDRGHLLARLLGGSGSRAENIVPLYGRTTNNMMMNHRLEKYLADRIRDGENIYYRATPIYRDKNDHVPLGVTIYAKGKNRPPCFMTIVNTPNAKKEDVPKGDSCL
jgi:hypothetical protein